MTISGCGGSDEAEYIGDEEAVRERLQEVEFEEKENARDTAATPAATREDVVNEEERTQGRR